jgi:hypothetical protein
VKVVVKKQGFDEYRHEPHSWFKATYSGLDETAWGRYLATFSGPAVHPLHALGFFSQSELAAAKAEAGSHAPATSYKKALARLSVASTATHRMLAPNNRKRAQSLLGGDSRPRSSTLGTINPNGATLQLSCINANNSDDTKKPALNIETNSTYHVGKGQFKCACMKENQCR